MTKKIACRECGTPTVSTSQDQLCFGCQIESHSGQETLFFDNLDGKDVSDVLKDRLQEGLPTIELGTMLGRGGMGIVFRGKQSKLDRDVAVKVLRPNALADDDFSARFLKEARAMARLQHSHIVAIYDFGQTDCGLSYIVMEYVDGSNLAEVMEDENKLATKDFLNVMADVADGLAFAHGLDVVHRDMKPHNVLVDQRGHAKIADFGIAKLEGDRHAERLTKTHQILGTPLYMSPEQAVGSREVDHRADLYALGVMLFEGLTGQAPGKARDVQSELSRFDGRVGSLLSSLLEKDIERRADSAAALALQCRQLAVSGRYGAKRRGIIGRMFGG